MEHESGASHTLRRLEEVAGTLAGILEPQSRHSLHIHPNEYAAHRQSIPHPRQRNPS